MVLGVVIMVGCSGANIITIGNSGDADKQKEALLLLFLKSQTGESFEDGNEGSGGDRREDSGSGGSSGSEKKQKRKADSTGRVNTRKLQHTEQITLQHLRQYFHLPIVEVAAQLGICTTLLKKICRRHNIHRWPFRQVRVVCMCLKELCHCVFVTLFS